MIPNHLRTTKRKTVLRGAGVLGPSLLLSSCTITRHLEDFQLLSTRHVGINSKYASQGIHSGMTSKTMSLFWPPSLEDISLRDAVNSCIRQGNGDLLSDAEISSRQTSYFFWFSLELLVKGEVWKQISTDSLNQPDELRLDTPDSLRGKE